MNGLSDEDRMEFLYREFNEYEDELGRDDCLTPWWDIFDEVLELMNFLESGDTLPEDADESEEEPS